MCSPPFLEKHVKTKLEFKSSQLKLFWYWMRERHSIYLRRFKSKEQYPWTKDQILQEYKFTNVYRQLDRVSLAWQDRYAHLLARKKLVPSDVLFHCVMFRLFNLPDTYDALFYGMRKWSLERAMGILERRKAEHEQIFTGAYIVPNVGREEPKIRVIAEAVDYVYKRRIKLSNKIRAFGTMEDAVRILRRVPTIGSFIAYEIACDLRFTKVLYHASDVFSWASPGPGAVRGLRRLTTGSAKKCACDTDYVGAMRQLFTSVPTDLKKHLDMGGQGVPFELREIEHSLCEFDKYMRVKLGEGRPRSRYRPPVERVHHPYGDSEE